MKFLIFYFLAVGTLAPADENVMEKVRETRQRNGFIGGEIEGEYDCLLGVQNRHIGVLSDRPIVKFLDLDRKKIITILVVDVAQDKHSGVHEAKALIGDINPNCESSGNFGILFATGDLEEGEENNDSRQFNYSFAFSTAHIRHNHVPPWLSVQLENSDICGLDVCPKWKQTSTLRNLHNLDVSTIDISQLYE